MFQILLPFQGEVSNAVFTQGVALGYVLLAFQAVSAPSPELCSFDFVFVRHDSAEFKQALFQRLP
jgi:hypothetical protein